MNFPITQFYYGFKSESRIDIGNQQSEMLCQLKLYSSQSIILSF